MSAGTGEKAVPRVGIFGGSFDPIHLGHLLLAEQAREQFALDEVVFVPARLPPHKLDRPLAPDKLRLEMTELAVAGHRQFSTCDIELRRTGPSYTVDTLRAFAEERPGAALFLLIGADSLREFPTWRDPAGILALAELLVMPRPGAETIDEWKTFGLPPNAAGRVRKIDSPLFGVASTDLRARLAAGRSIRYLVSPAVEEFLRAKGLYR